MATVDVSDVNEGSVLRIEGKLWRVAARESRGTGKTARVVHLTLSSIPPGSHLERNLKPGEKVEEVNVERHPIRYLYRDGENFHFMDTETYEQVAIPAASVGAAGEFMREDMEIQVLVYEGQPIDVEFPDTVELRVVSTLPPVHATETSAMKEATLENGMVVLVPQFIKEGDLVEVEVGTRRYLSRVKG